MPGRDDFWNIGYPMLGALVYTTMAIATVAVAYSLYRRARMWRLGRPEPDLGPWWPRIGRFFQLAALDLFAHREFTRSRELYAGLMHFAIFWGFVLLFIATVMAAIEFNTGEYLDWLFPTVRFRVQTGFVWDIFGGGLATLGIAMAAWRRYVIRPGRLNTFLDDGFNLAIMFALNWRLTGRRS